MTAAGRSGEWATLTGRIVYDGKAPDGQARSSPPRTSKSAASTRFPTKSWWSSKDGGIANAVIMLRTKNVKVAPSYAEPANDKVALDNKDCRFEPHVAIVLHRRRSWR